MTGTSRRRDGSIVRRSLLIVLLSCSAGVLPVSRLDANLVINEVLASNRHTNVDEFNASSDWFEICNTGAEPVDLAGHWLSDDPKLLQKWQCPGVTLEPGDCRLMWCSGRNQTIPESDVIIAADSAVPFTPSLISLDSDWRYVSGVPGDADPPADWYQLEFDDNLWAVGKPSIGFGQEGLTTELPEGTSVALLRHTFNVADPASVTNLVLNVAYDDGIGLYFNGVRLLSLFIGGGDPTFDTQTSRTHGAQEAERFDLSAHRGLLRTGENVVAIALVNRRASNDLRLDPELGMVEPIFHTNFQLNAAGDAVFLSTPDGTLLDAVVFPPQARDRSYGRFPDGNGEFFYLLKPTPAAPNDGELISSERIPNDIDFSPEGGVVDDLDVTLSSDFPFEGFEIRYETSGDVPTADSTLYQEPISVTGDTVIRAVGILQGESVTDVVTKSYLTGSVAKRLTLPILSIAMPPEDFEFVHTTANGHGRLGEREGHVEVFSSTGVSEVGVGFGLRLHGGAGRQGDFRTKKSYRAYFRGEYGATKLRYPIIPDTDVRSFDKLVLRANFNDAMRNGDGASLIRDQLIRDLHEQMGDVISHGSWYNLFVNGAYRGLYNVVERIEAAFLASYFPADDENWDVIKTGNQIQDGADDDWRDFISFMDRGRLDSETEFDKAAETLDIQAFTDYMILQMWSQNQDWPQNNWAAAKPQRPDGQWMFFVWDAEFACGLSPTGFSTDSFSQAVSQAGSDGSPAATVLGGLLRNQGYQEFFLEELERHYEETLHPSNVLQHINRLAEIIQVDIGEEARLHGRSTSGWTRALGTMRNFARNRNTPFREHLLRSRLLTVPAVVSVSPKTIAQRRPQVVRFVTRRATEATQILLNDIPADDVVFLTANLLDVTIPLDERLEGVPTITISDPKAGQTATTGIFGISYPRPKVDEITPAVGSINGGGIVTITGEDFSDSVRVEFDDVPAPSARLLDDGETLEVVTPPAKIEGPVEVSVFNTAPREREPRNTTTFTYVADLPFIRGDCNGDGRVQGNVTDASFLLRFNFAGVGEPPCLAACDVNGDGKVLGQVTDAVALLEFNFRGGEAPPQPFPDCGVGTATDAALGCDMSPACD